MTLQFSGAGRRSRVLHIFALPIATLLGASAFAQEAQPGSVTQAETATGDEAQLESAATTDVATLEEVIVTAQKRATNLQDTPISVSVVNGEDLKNRNAISLLSLADGSIPSLRVSPFATRSSALAIGIRGIGAAGDANQPARDQGVGVYVDGVFLGRAQGLGTALYDVERIEVLKGPQGTLFGRNSEGGAISIVTKQPTGEFGVRFNFGVANYDGYNSGVHMDLPRYGDLSFKIDAVLNRRGGTTDNPMRGEDDFNSFNKRGARLTGLWQPAENFDASYAYDNSYDATTPYHLQLLTADGPLALPLQQAGASQDRRDSALLGAPQEESIGKTEGHLLLLDWAVSERARIKSISSYRELEQGQFDNGFIDFSIFTEPNGTFGRYSLAQLDQHQWSQELQLIGNTDTLEYVAGAFYYSETASDNAQTPLTNRWNEDGSDYTVNTDVIPLDLSEVRVDRASKASTDSLGVFGQGTWTPVSLDDLHITAGLRYTKDEKDGALQTVNGDATDLRFDDSWNRVDPMVNIAYDLAGKTMMVYAKYSTGFKAGGANSRSTDYRPFDPEEVTAYELGFKSQFWSRRARLNLALFDSTIKDKQVDFNLPYDPTSGETRTTLVTANAVTDGESRGAELEFNVMPLDNLILGLNYAYTKTDDITSPDPFAGDVLVTVKPLFAPENAGSASIDYRIPFDAWSLMLHLDGNWSDGYYTGEYDQTATDDSFIVNARIALADVRMNEAGATAEFSLWSRNLLDEEHLFYRVDALSELLGETGIFNDPRTFGIEVAVRF